MGGAGFTSYQALPCPSESQVTVTVPAYRVTVHVTAWNGLNINVFHLSNATVLPADFGAAAVTLFSSFYNVISTAYPSGTAIGIGQIINLGTSPVTYVPFDATPFDISPSGSRSDARQAATITWRTAVATRRGRGRSFIGPLNLDVESSSTGLWSPTFQTTLQDGAFDLISESATANVPLQVYSRRDNAVHLVTGSNVPLTPHTLRSRTLR